MKTLKTITTSVFLVLMVLTSCEDEFVTPMQSNIETVVDGDTITEDNILPDLLIGEWYELESSKDSISLSFDGSSCHFYSTNEGNIFDFSVLYATTDSQIIFEENDYLLHDISEIEMIDDNNFVMTTSHLVDNDWIFTDVQHFTRIN